MITDLNCERSPKPSFALTVSTSAQDLETAPRKKAFTRKPAPQLLLPDRIRRPDTTAFSPPPAHSPLLAAALSCSDSATSILPKNMREFFYSPKSEKRCLFTSYLQRKNSQKEDFSMAEPVRPPLSPGASALDRSMQLPSRVAPSLSQSVAHPPPPAECCYCLNNREANSILSKLNAKLEQQLVAQRLSLQEMGRSCSQLQGERDQLAEELNRKKEEICSQEQAFVQRTAAMRADLARMGERLKYCEIENAMLLRLKTEHMQLSRNHAVLTH